MKTNGAGHSDITVSKQYYLSKILLQHWSTCKAIYKNHRMTKAIYRYVDLTAGPGVYSDCLGSPLVFLNIVKDSSVKYQAYLIENNPMEMESLERRVKGYNNTFLFEKDNEEIAPEIIGNFPQGQYGLIYCDNNGIPQFDLLAELSKMSQMKKIDILIRYNGSSVKRNLHQTGAMRFLDYLDKVQKKYWYIQEVQPGCRWHWTFLMGLNWDGLNVMKKHGFYWITADKGQDIVEKLHYTNDERQVLGSWRQGGLWSTQPTQNT